MELNRQTYFTAVALAAVIFSLTGCTKPGAIPGPEPLPEPVFYADGEVSVYQASSKEHPVTLVFTGDGYTADMFEKGEGKFDRDIDRAIEALFTIEPYKTYREYFTIYKIAALSREEGVSIKRPSRKYKDTRFGCMWENKDASGGNSTAIECNLDSVARFWATVPGLESDAAQTFAPFCILVNAEIRAGTVQTIPTDLTLPHFGGLEIKSVAMIPLGTSFQSLESLVQHEIGGHAIGLLADEYDTFKTGTITTFWKDFLTEYQNYGPLGFGHNICFSAEPADAPWAPFMGIDKYVQEGTGMYEGAMGYGKGVWRSSEDSCMKNNLDLYNVQSRYLIYKRIKYTAGEPYSIEDFILHDRVW